MKRAIRSVLASALIVFISIFFVFPVPSFAQSAAVYEDAQTVELTGTRISGPFTVENAPVYTAEADVQGGFSKGFSLGVRLSGSKDTVWLLRDIATAGVWTRYQKEFSAPSSCGGSCQMEVVFENTSAQPVHIQSLMVRTVSGAIDEAGASLLPETRKIAADAASALSEQIVSLQSTATNIPVTTLTQGFVADGQCSLAEAIQAANTDASVDGCPAGVGPDVIGLSAGTYNLQAADNTSPNGPNGLPVITSTITIQGAGLSSTVLFRPNGTSAPFFRLFEVGSTGVLKLFDLTVKGGHTGNLGNGGALYNVGTLEATNVSFEFNTGQTSGNGGGAIYNDGGTVTLTGVAGISNTTNGAGGAIFNLLGAVTVANSRLAGNAAGTFGGALASFGTLTLEKSTVDTNTAQNGGGINSSGQLTLSSSTLSGNTAQRTGAASGAGGGLMYEGGFNGDTAAGALTNVTVSGNTSDGTGGGIGFNTDNGTLNLFNVTSAANIAVSGGALANIGVGTVRIENTLLSAGSGGGTCSGTITSNGYNIETATACNLSGSGDISSANPQIGPLQNNGGNTQTHALSAGSPAVDAGNPAHCPPLDQRDIERPQDGNSDGVSRCDIGAVERAGGNGPSVTPTPTGVVPTPTFTQSPTPSRTPTPIPGANLLANAAFEKDADGNGKPDSWSGNASFTRSSAAKHGGTYSGRHKATSNTSYVIYQTANNIVGSASYAFSGWTFIPSTSDSFTYKLQVQWRNSSGSTISTQTIKTYSAGTSWNQATATLKAPSGAKSAWIRMNVSSLNATIYADDFSFRKL